VHQHRSSRGRRVSVGAATTALSLGLCLCAGQLVATPAQASTTTTTAATAARPRFSGPTASPTTVAWGAKVTVTATLIDPRTSKAVHTGVVRLQALRGGAWRTWSTKRLPANGTVAFSAEPHMTGYFRTQFTGAPGLLWAASRSVRVVVKSSGTRVVNEAKRHVGAPYRYGAAGPYSFDCSGFTMYVFRKAAGKKLPHQANAQQRYGRAVSRSAKRAGDLIIFRSGSYGYHAAIYAGGGYMYDAPHSGATVGRHKIWSNNYVVRRLV
jgi:peptidoglycan DL-endopeptidase CwlO